MNYPKDPRLAELGKRLLATEFLTPLTPQAVLRQPAIEQAEIENQLRGVNLSPNSKPTFLVQSYVGGEIRTFCSVPLDVFRACRIADLLTYKFGHLRLRFIRQPEEKDYNFTRAQAEADYANEPFVREVVDQIFEHLRSINALLDPDKPDSVLARRSAKSVPKNEIVAALEKLTARIEALEAKLK